jgi:hypothetical protein
VGGFEFEEKLVVAIVVVLVAFEYGTVVAVVVAD